MYKDLLRKQTRGKKHTRISCAHKFSSGYEHFSINEKNYTYCLQQLSIDYEAYIFFACIEKYRKKGKK